MKKYIIYIGILVVGIVLGWILFGGSSNKEADYGNNTVVETNQMWTCSMHPQIMQHEFGSCPICGMDLIPSKTSEDGLAKDQFKLTKNAMALANIQTSIVGSSNVSKKTIKLSGKIVENEETIKVQVSHFSGRIEQLHVNFKGEEVKKGQLLANIYSPELFAAQQELITAASIKKSQPALYKAVRNKLKLWKLSESQINQIETSGKVKEVFPVYATVSGTVLEKLVEQGDYIKQGETLFTIANLNSVWANFDVYENQIGWFKKGQEIVVATRTNPNKEYKTKISFIDPVLNVKTRTLKLRAVLNNTTNVFKPGMFIEGEIKSISSNKQALSIPSTAVLWTGERSVVYIKINPNEPVFEMREVTLGNYIGKKYEVLEGLKSDDEIVTNGTFTIDAAAQLQGKKSMMNKGINNETTNSQSQISSNTNINQSKTTERVEVATKFREQIKLVFADYINLKDALINENLKVAKQSANNMLKNLSKVDIKLLKDKDVNNNWMNLEKEIKTSTKLIINSTKIEELRSHFQSVSLHLTSAIQLFGVDKKVYIQFCPMANNNKGAYWLSKEEKILNPYFGNAMLNCGTVEQTIK